LDALFGDRGLVVIDGDDPLLKKEFSSIISSDIFSEHSHTAIINQTEKLMAA